MKEILTYRCEYCGRLYVRKGNCKNHENICIKNPSNKPICHVCVHYVKAHAYVGEFGGIESVTPAYCKKKKKSMQPYYSERSNYDVMPRLSCDDFKIEIPHV